MLKILSLGLALLLVSGCASYGVVDNIPQKTVDAPDGYSIRSGGGRGWGSGEIGLVLAFSGGGKVFVEKKLDRKPPRRLVVISVNASTDPEPEMDVSNKQPSLKETIGAMSDVQLHRYNVATLELMDVSVKRWARDLSTPGRPVRPYFIQVGFRDIQQPEQLRFFNQVPTSFSLSDEQVDKLIAAGRELLRNYPDFQRFLAGLGGARAAGG